MKIQAKHLSEAQYKLMEALQKGKVKCTDGNRKTYKKLIEYGLADYHNDYDHVIATKKGKSLEL
jgi:hypothetical protein